MSWSVSEAAVDQLSAISHSVSKAKTSFDALSRRVAKLEAAQRGKDQ